MPFTAYADAATPTSDAAMTHIVPPDIQPAASLLQQPRSRNRDSEGQPYLTVTLICSGRSDDVTRRCAVTWSCRPALQLHRAGFHRQGAYLLDTKSRCAHCQLRPADQVAGSERVTCAGRVRDGDLR